MRFLFLLETLKLVPECSISYYDIIHSNYNFITLSHWIISNTIKILIALTNICTRIPTVIFFVSTIIFTFSLTCFIIPFLIWITNCTIEFAFTITLNMSCHQFSFIFVCYHIKYFNIYLLFLLEHIFFGDNTLQLPAHLFKLIISR